MVILGRRSKTAQEKSLFLKGTQCALQLKRCLVLKASNFITLDTRRLLTHQRRDAHNERNAEVLPRFFSFFFFLLSLLCENSVVNVLLTSCSFAGFRELKIGSNATF